ncbi:MAG: YidB family protein [Rhodoplanes sp.]
MSRGFPSMTALLGLLAIAGYQNRDKIAEMLRGLGQGQPGAGQGGLGGLLGQISNLGGANPGGLLSGGLGELIDRFKQAGQGEIADSWVNPGPNKPCSPSQIEQAIGPEVLETLTKQTGLPRQELLSRLCRELPGAVDKYTPQGHIPTEAELSRA